MPFEGFEVVQAVQELELLGPQEVQQHEMRIDLSAGQALLTCVTFNVPLFWCVSHISMSSGAVLWKRLGQEESAVCKKDGVYSQVGQKDQKEEQRTKASDLVVQLHGQPQF